MALDTAEKRRAAAGLPFLPFLPGVTPIASKDVDWRHQVAQSYYNAPAIAVGDYGEISASRGSTLVAKSGHDTLIAASKHNTLIAKA